MDKATWVGGPRDGQPVTLEDWKRMSDAIRAGYEPEGTVRWTPEEEEGIADVSRDPVTGRLTIHRTGTYRITVPLVNDTSGASIEPAERIAALEAALHALTEQEPVYGEGRLCVYCDNTWDAEGREVVHTAECPWGRALTLLKGVG